MAAVNFVCSSSKCQTVVNEHALSAGGLHYLNDAWVRGVRSGSVTTCQAHYHDANQTAYQAYFRSVSRRNRELG